MLNPHDRRDLASLGLMVLVYGLAVAPVLHAVVGHAGGLGGAAHVHAHGDKAHTHGARAVSPLSPERPRETDGHRREGHGQDGHKHLTGSVEHLSAVATTWAMVHVPAVRWVSWVTEVARGPAVAPGASPRPTAMPQGP
ncbi:hypothetical protein FJV41_12965 [Myxococcus llanfairpwllgwyngyllgogerychwyrndrobwllllantysiliogogogochensis]|uniref:Uncharacterized protein n=1 Tax=Myxococcus llanfairpwllgwyngyllgogerychwyrndrobwllllantysiliogogogochensis TaxID=2590453 RepID=A0A540X2T6_9BACT|nr:hypothetical protein FJV41_12965 [Myxococcus llanfairpwllgwyngyllgogerychwyrndrobwllllantysiliogogogochensis]